MMQTAVRTREDPVAAARDMSNRRRPLLVDPVELGKKVRGARHGAGYDKAEDCAADLAAVGVEMQGYTLRAIERGDQLPSLEQIAALVIVLNPPAGIHYFMTPAMPPELAQRFGHANCGG